MRNLLIIGFLTHVNSFLSVSLTHEVSQIPREQAEITIIMAYFNENRIKPSKIIIFTYTVGHTTSQFLQKKSQHLTAGNGRFLQPRNKRKDV